MTVYVDDVKTKYRRMIFCHMVADTQKELHDMAERIGVARKWHHRGHYNICKAMRTKAVGFGAVEVTRRRCAQIRRRMQDG